MVLPQSLLLATVPAGSFMGLSLFVGCLTEVAVFAYADAIIKTYGVHEVMNASLMLMGVRQLGLAAMTQPYQVLLVEALAGPIFALGWTGQRAGQKTRDSQ
jgi:hypothetical protein